jgi:hypothetical protein
MGATRAAVGLVLAGAVLSGCAGAGLQGATAADRMASWAKGAQFTLGEQAIDSAAKRIAGDVRSRDRDSLQLDCVGMKIAAEKARGFLPTPNHVVTIELDQAYNLLYEGSESCVKHALGAGTTSPAITKAVALIHQGLGYFDHAVARMDRIEGKSTTSGSKASSSSGSS